LRAVLDGVGYGWVTSNNFRKTVATRLDEVGLTAREIADQLGHARPSMTLDVYLGRRQSVNVAVAAVLDRAAASQAVYWS
jgi:integrase